MRDAPAAVVTGNGEALETEAAHHFDLIQCHRARRVVDVTFSVRRLARVAVSAQIGEHDGKVLGETPRDFVPRYVRLRVTVQQE